MSQEATIEQVINELGAAAQKVLNDLKEPKKPKNPAIHALVLFTLKETCRMNPVFIDGFLRRRRIAHVTKEKLENGQFMYTIKYTRDGYKITVAHSKLRKAKKAFISKTWEAAQ